MARRADAAASPVTWCLALVFLFAVGVAITRTPILWGKTAFENSSEPNIVFAQAYQTARKIYATERPADARVVLLGDSRMRLGAREELVDREFEELDSSLDVRTLNLGIFGAGPNVSEIVSRHLHQVEPDLVVVGLAGTDLVKPFERQPKHPAIRLLDIGWRDGPIPPTSWSERTDRWLRTAWPLYRFREFARAAVEDRVLSRPDRGEAPESFATTLEFFEYLHGTRGEGIEAAYRDWLAQQSLENFVAYCERQGDRPEGIRRRVREGPDLDRESPAVRTLDAVLERMAEQPWPTIVLLMPENPVLDLDQEYIYHRLGLSDRAADWIRESADRWGLPVVDARRWMPADAFLDFDHLMPERSGFEKPLAREILHALGT